MYTDFYKLSGLPFQLTPDPRFFYGSSVHKRAMAHLTFGLGQGEGFIVITGDVGAGKTTLMGHLLATLDSERYVAASLVTTQLGADDMLRMVCAAFGIPNEGADKATLLQRIGAYFRVQAAEGKRCLLLVDEVQNFTFNALEELRMLSNFQQDGQALLQSFLLGQPQFRRTLASPDLDQLRQRVIASYHLGPMDPRETRDYIRHRLAAVDWRDDPVFHDTAFEKIYEHTRGVPRLINVLCSRLLLYGFLDELHEIDGDTVKRVADDLDRETKQVLEPEEAPTAGSPAAEAPPTAEAGSGDAFGTPRGTAAASYRLPVPSTAPEPAPGPAEEPLELEPRPHDYGRNAAFDAVDDAEFVENDDVSYSSYSDEAPARPQSANGEADPAVVTALEEEIEALRRRLENTESQVLRHERMLRWTQLMLKHHERMLRRRGEKAISSA